METFSSDILLLDQVYALYLRLRTQVLRKLYTTVNLKLLQPVFNHLSQLPLADPHSPECVLLTSISDSIQRCIDPVAGTGPAISLPPIVSAPITGPDNYHNVLDFILELLPLLDSSLPTSPTPRQQTVIDNGFDKFLPFREHAPSRLRVKSPSGPFHPSNIDRPGAFASACIFRGITFSCRFIQDTPSNFFPDLAAWDRAVADFRAKPGVRDGDRDICDKAAYGTPLSGRGLNHAAKYFAAESHWHDYFARHNTGGKVNFVRLYAWLQHDGSETRGKMLPQMGTLITLLLAGDLCYAGKAAMPTAEEMGILVGNLNKGARSGLQDAFIISSDAVATQIKDGFVGLYNYLDRELTQDQKTRMTFDPITLEHILCKYKRVGART